MKWETVCKLDLIPVNAGACALIDGVQVAIFRVGDELYAIDNHDPISGANVLARGIICHLKGELCVASPIYKQHFSLRTGQCLEDSAIKVNTYQIQNASGVIEVAARTREAA
jgi:nitrite reductase (NADH) small subunit